MGARKQTPDELVHQLVGGAMPHGAIRANRAAQAPHNTYDQFLFWYEDRPFKCRDCGVRETWTAEQQQWYFEVAKGPIYAQPVRCGPCRKKIREAKAAQKEHMAEMATRKPGT